MATVKAFKDDGLFIGQKPEFFEVVGRLARDADEATRKVCVICMRVSAKSQDAAALIKAPRRPVYGSPNSRGIANAD